MKKLIAVIFLFSISAFSQTSQSILTLENQVSEGSKTTQSFEFNFNTAPAKKNVGLAIIYSLLLPGMGELYAGNYASGKFFTIAEGALWGTYIGINTYAGWEKDRYVAFAASNGGVNTAGKDDDYLAAISEYTSIQDYNNDMAKQREFSKILDENKYYWKWNGTDRRTYREKWVSSEQAYNNLRFVVGALLLNRIASAVNAVRLTASYNKSLSTQTSWNVSTGVSNISTLPPSFTLNFQTTF